LQVVLSPRPNCQSPKGERNTTIIHLQSLKSKRNFSEKSAEEIISESEKAFRIEEAICPHCGAKGNLKRHDMYYRNLIDICDGQHTSTVIEITRLICECEHTHAVLPDIIVPYGIYSVRFILTVLEEYYSSQADKNNPNRLTVSGICAKYGITHTMLYKWKGIYTKNKDLWLGITKSYRVPAIEHITQLIKSSALSVYSIEFFEKAGMMFLQRHRHRGKAIYCRGPTPPDGRNYQLSDTT